MPYIVCMQKNKTAKELKFGETFFVNGRNWYKLNPNTELPGRVAMQFPSEYCIAKQIGGTGDVVGIPPLSIVKVD